MKDICDSLASTAQSSLVLDQKVYCWIDDFITHIGGIGSFPSTSFSSDLAAFVATDEGKDAINNGYLGYWDNKLRFTSIKTLAVGEKKQPYDGMIKVVDPWKDYVETMNTASGVGFNKCKWSSPAWTFMQTERTMVKGAIQGVAISLLFAFAVLLLSTMNILIAIYSTICIVLIVVSVMGLM